MKTLGSKMSTKFWSFVGKVYTILTLQLLATIGIGATVKFIPSVANFLLQTNAGIAVIVITMITPFVLVIPIVFLSHLKPVNYFLVAIFTVALACQVGIVCAVTPGKVVLESVSLTAVAFVTLTLYAFWATWRGYDFSLLAPFLSQALLILIICGLVQIFFPMGKAYVMMLGAFGSIVFCGYIVYDTYMLIERHEEDNDYIIAAVELYLDIVNLFLSLVQLLGAGDDGGDGSCFCCSDECCECLGGCCECLGSLIDV